MQSIKLTRIGQRVGPLAREGCEDCIYLPGGAGIEDSDLQSENGSSRFDVSAHLFAGRAGLPPSGGAGGAGRLRNGRRGVPGLRNAIRTALHPPLHWPVFGCGRGCASAGLASAMVMMMANVLVIGQPPTAQATGMATRP